MVQADPSLGPIRGPRQYLESEYEMMTGLDKWRWICIGICTKGTLLGSGKHTGLGSNKSSALHIYLCQESVGVF